jgi:hypothetical protein
MNFHSQNIDSVLNRRTWFKRTGASLIGLAVGSRLTGAQSISESAKPKSATPASRRRKAPPQPGINHGFDEGFF